MPSTLSATPGFSTAGLSVPASADARTAASVEGPFQGLFDRAAYLRAATDGLLTWGGNARVSGAGTNNGNFGVYVPAIKAVGLLDGSTWRALSLASETQLTSTADFGGNTLDVSTHYYVYAYVDGGALAFDVSTTAPEAGGIWKTGAASTHRYLFSFFTDTSGVPLPQRRTRDGRTIYRTSGIGAADLQALFSGAGTSWTDVNLRTKGVPASARIALVETVLSTVSYTLELRTKGDTAGSRLVQALTGAVEIETDASGVIQYRNGNSALAVDLNVIGYAE